MTLIPDQPVNCPSCGKKFGGPFCAACGEKQTSPKDYTLKKYSAQAVDMFTHFDGKFFTTIKYLLFYPGKLTEEYLAGRRVKLMKPIQLYLVINLLYFFLMKRVDVFITYLELQIKNNQGLAQDVKLRADKVGITVSEYIERFDTLLPTTSKTFIFILIPSIAIGIWLFYFKRIRTFVPHLIFATHFFTFFLAFTLLFFELIFRWFNPEALTFNQKMIGVLSGVLVLTVYLFFALKREYKQKILLTLVKTIALMTWTLAMIGLYNQATTWINLLRV